MQFVLHILDRTSIFMCHPFYLSRNFIECSVLGSELFVHAGLQYLVQNQVRSSYIYVYATLWFYGHI